MTLKEYTKVQDFTYLEYCDYLQDKYGIGRADYMTKEWEKDTNVLRLQEGLIAHHKYEDHAIMLSQKERAMQHPYEWQFAENIVYCDALEHLLLHILICENPSPNCESFETVGIGSIFNYIVPELNDVYSGWVADKEYKKICHTRVINDKDVYLILLKRLKEFCKNNSFDANSYLYTSFNEPFGKWSSQLNEKLFKAIEML